MNTARYAILGATVLGLALPASAHTMWLVPGTAKGDYRVMFGGHEGKLETYAAAKLKTVQAFDADGRPLAVQRRDTADGVRLQVAGSPSVVAAHFDNGIHARTAEGRSVEQSMDKTPGSKSAVNALKYHKTIVAWTPQVTRMLDQPMEVTPLSSARPQAGKPIRVQVRIDGKPAAGVKLGRGEEGADGVTDANGVATFVPTKGFNKLWAGRRIPVAGNPRYTELSYEYLLGFDAL